MSQAATKRTYHWNMLDANASMFVSAGSRAVPSCLLSALQRTAGPRRCAGAWRLSVRLGRTGLDSCNVSIADNRRGRARERAGRTGASAQRRERAEGCVDPSEKAREARPPDQPRHLLTL